MYNCTSPLFFNQNAPVTRCEINTYVKTDSNEVGTVILDYTSNSLSLDPVHLYKRGNKDTQFHHVFSTEKEKRLHCMTQTEKISFDFEYDGLDNGHPFPMSDTLVHYTDNIFYKNGYYDKLYYDSSLTHSSAVQNIAISQIRNLRFQYKDLCFEKMENSFCFQKRLDFICEVWKNVCK